MRLNARDLAGKLAPEGTAVTKRGKALLPVPPQNLVDRIRKRFAFSGVRLIGIADILGNGCNLLYGVKSILSEQYLKDLRDKTSRGLRDRAQGDGEIRELEVVAGREVRRVEELGAMLAPLELPRPEDVVARIRDLGALFDKSPRDAREALKHLLDDGIQLHPLEDGRYRARWTVRGGALLFGGTTKPPVQTEGLEERSTLWVAGAGFELTTFGL